MKIEVDDNFMSQMIIEGLKDYHNTMLGHPEEDGICEAIEKVLSHYLNLSDYDSWYKSVYGDIDNVE